MKKIKLIALVIILLLLSLIFISFHLGKVSESSSQFKDRLNAQKMAAQNIAKEVLYIYTKNTNNKNLDISLQNFLDGITYIQDKNIRQQSELFTEKVLEFKEQVKYKTPYSKILLDKIVHQIYLLNQDLLKQFNFHIKAKQVYTTDIMHTEKIVQYTVLFLLFIAFVYLIIYILKTQSSFEVLIRKIESSTKSIDQVEQQVEKYLEKDLDIKDETLIIESLEELTKANIRLKQLQKRLQKND